MPSPFAKNLRLRPSILTIVHPADSAGLLRDRGGQLRFEREDRARQCRRADRDGSASRPSRTPSTSSTPSSRWCAVPPQSVRSSRNSIEEQSLAEISVQHSAAQRSHHQHVCRLERRRPSVRSGRSIPPIEIQGKLPPLPARRYADRWIAPQRGSAPVDHYLFLDADRKELGLSEQTTSYDPRSRVCGIAPRSRAGELSVSDVDVFATLGLVGFTVGAPFYVDGALRGVAAADITLDGLSDLSLAERKISNGTLSYILDHQGRVIANSERVKTYASHNGRVELQHIASLGNELPAIAFGFRPREQREDVLLRAWRTRSTWRGSTSLPPAVRQEMAALRHHAAGRFHKLPSTSRTSAWPCSARSPFCRPDLHHLFPVQRRLKSPLERLALKVTKIQDLEGDNLPPLQVADPRGGGSRRAPSTRWIRR